MHEREAITFELLHHEAFAAEEADRQLLLEVDAERHAARRAEECILLADQHPAELTQIHRQDLPRVGRGERDAQLGRRLIRVDGDEQRLAGDDASPGAQQLAEEAALRTRAVAEHSVHLNAGVHEHHAAGLADGRFARVELDLDELHLGTLDFVIHHVHRHVVCPRNRSLEAMLAAAPQRPDV